MIAAGPGAPVGGSWRTSQLGLRRLGLPVVLAGILQYAVAILVARRLFRSIRAGKEDTRRSISERQGGASASIYGLTNRSFRFVLSANGL